MVAFKDLWYRHPANNSTQYPCIAPHTLTNMEGKVVHQGFPVFGNQCSIRMGVCLKNAGVTNVHTATCGVHGPEEQHFIRAADLARALAGASIEGVGKVERITGADAAHFYGKLYGRTGIIYIQDYWKRHGETTPTGDHIDVWNGYRSSTKWLMEWFSWLGYYSNYVQAKEIWFWDVK
ncbi:MAG TPA: T6SS effector amidase Tae4 family protein [Hyphomicrobiaceae bacterium]|nr:T6SS effector amidase Tae4 family protein [Hyphomicrobiaceae bacterium]